MHLNARINSELRKYEDKIRREPPIRRQYGVQYRIIEKNVSIALPSRTTHQLKPKNILTSQHSPLKKQIDYDFIPTFASRHSTLTERPSPTRDMQRSQKLGSSHSLKSRCQSAFSRTQALKNSLQERKGERVLSSLGVMLQERKGSQRGEQVYTLNLLRIHGSSEKRIQFNNPFD